MPHGLRPTRTGRGAEPKRVPATSHHRALRLRVGHGRQWPPTRHASAPVGVGLFSSNASPLSLSPDPEARPSHASLEPRRPDLLSSPGAPGAASATLRWLHRTAVSDFREMTQTSGGHGDHGTAGVRFIAPKRLKVCTGCWASAYNAHA
ncbi:hypothetical protein EJB05_23412, partial [Eragrostis curvula]